MLIFELIKSCVAFVSYRALVNGEATDRFYPTSGLRQGDPMSPYLFVICMEKLSQIINYRVEKKEWKGLKDSRSGPLISHTFFTDDLILFSEASTKQAEILKESIELFYNLSGQKVSFAENVPNDLANNIARILNSSLVKDLGKYLGVMLIHNRINSRTYSNLLDKMKNGLASWKGKFFSVAGSVVLTKSVFNSLPIYHMNTVKLPGAICGLCAV